MVKASLDLTTRAQGATDRVVLLSVRSRGPLARDGVGVGDRGDAGLREPCGRAASEEGVGGAGVHLARPLLPQRFSCGDERL